jgi:hypothetical protein
MKNARHIGRTSGGDDKKFEFASPDARNTARTAFHRYLPVESHAEMTAQISYSVRGEDNFDLDFRARWWPAPDAAE